MVLFWTQFVGLCTYIWLDAVWKEQYLWSIPSYSYTFDSLHFVFRWTTFFCLIPQSKTLSPTDNKCFSAANWYVCLFVCGRVLSLILSFGFFFPPTNTNWTKQAWKNKDWWALLWYLSAPHYYNIWMHLKIFETFVLFSIFTDGILMNYKATCDLLKFSPRQNVQVRSCCLKCWSYFCVLGP